ncbi:protein RIC-3 [Conger conger]|uniref:protein RIC-3 n=1 Tax=Conger conger TaxID=82655 RepID=UPI002A5A469B|nr:protein RIC-3 [Conger conger]
MSMSTFQKVTLVSCLVLCASLLLPKMLLSRGKKEVGQPEAGQGRFPPMMHRQQMPDGQWGAASPYSKAHSADAIAKAKGGGIGGGGKSNLMGQIIPIYGFGILLYILYILFKITSKGKITKPENRFPALKSENMKRKITDYELTQLQEKLRETEEVMERIVSKAGHSPNRIKSVSVEHEEKLLQQLKEITRVMQEGKLIEGMDGVSPEMEAEEASYTEDWEGYPEETYPQHEESCSRQNYDTVVLEDPKTDLPTPEELAERMEEEPEGAEIEQEEVEPQPEVQCQNGEGERTRPRHRGGKQISFREQRDVYRYPEEGTTDEYNNEEAGEQTEEEEEEEEEDPVVLAERLSFSGQVSSPSPDLEDAEGEKEEEEEELFLMDECQERDRRRESDLLTGLGLAALRKRGKKEGE